MTVTIASSADAQAMRCWSGAWVEQRGSFASTSVQFQLGRSADITWMSMHSKISIEPVLPTLYEQDYYSDIEESEECSSSVLSQQAELQSKGSKR